MVLIVVLLLACIVFLFLNFGASNMWLEFTDLISNAVNSITDFQKAVIVIVACIILYYFWNSKK